MFRPIKPITFKEGLQQFLLNPSEKIIFYYKNSNRYIYLLNKLKKTFKGEFVAQKRPNICPYPEYEWCIQHAILINNLPIIINIFIKESERNQDHYLQVYLRKGKL